MPLTSSFDALETTVREQGADAALEQLAEQLREQGRHHELFDVRLMQARRAHGLPVIMNASFDELPLPQREAMENAYLAACREVGHALLNEGKVRESWMYLRAVGDKDEVRQSLQRLVDENLAENDAIIELAVHEGLYPRLGFYLIIEQYGICNAITTFDSEMPRRSRPDQQQVAELLVDYLHHELQQTLRADIADQQGSDPQEQSIADLVSDRDWLFENNNYHIDASHLNAVVRFALALEDRDALGQAIDLCEYGRRLGAQFQFAGQRPFEDHYASHALFFHAVRGEQVEEALAYFGDRASAAAESGEATPVEVYVALLARMGRYREAIDAHARWLPPHTPTLGFAPTLLDLARQGGEYGRLQEIARERDDMVSFAAAIVAERGADSPTT